MSDMSLDRRAPRRQFRYDPNAVRGEEVYRDAHRHRRLVRWLKIVLPVTALAAVVVFFVAIKVVTSDLSELFSIAGMTMDTKNLVMDKPHISGFKGTEHSYEVHAERAVQDLANPKIVRLETIEAEFGLSKETRVSLDATAGVFDGERETLQLSDGIAVSTTDGYAAQLQGARIDLDGGALASDGTVEITTPEGVIRANSLTVSDRGKKIVFEGGVSVTYTPPPNTALAAPAPASQPAGTVE